MWKIFLILSFCSVSFALTIDEAVKKGLENNYLLKSYESAVKSGEYETEAAGALKMPSLFFDSSYTIMDEEKKLDARIAPGISSSMTQVKDNYFDATVGLKYNIFTGGAATSNVRLNKYSEQSSRLDLLEFKNSLIFEIKKSYINILKLLAYKDIALSHHNSLNGHYNDVEKFYKQGIVAQIDLLQTNVKLKEAKQNLTKMENLVKVAKSGLNVLINNSAENNEPDIQNIGNINFDNISDINLLYTEAIRRRPIIKMLDAQVSALKESKNIQKSGLMPKIYAVAGYSYNNQNDDITPKGSFFGKIGVNFTLDWNYPLRKIDSTNEKIVSLNRKKSGVMSQIELQVKEAFENFQTASENLEVAQSAVKESREYFRIIKLKYENGLASNTDVLDAEAMLTSALNSERNAYYDLLLAYFQIEKTTGRNLR